MYNDHRSAMGADVVAALTQFYCGKSLKDLHLLDAGCGTGLYSKAFIELGIGHVTLIDASSGMLEKAHGNLEDAIARGQVKGIVNASIPPLPFPDESFDIVFFSLVLHHLHKPTLNEKSEYVEVNQCIQEARRVLKSCGVMVIITILPETMSRHVWYSQLNMKVTERFKKCFPSVDKFEEIITSSKFKCVTKLNLLGANFLTRYYDFEKICKETWRYWECCWSYASEEEIKEAEKHLIALKESGELEQWVKEHDHVKTSGMLTLLVSKAI